MLLNYYKHLLGEVPSFLKKYLKDPNLLRLKNIHYFCGMDYASKEVYPFAETITRFDHSLTVALLVYRLTLDKTKTIAGLFHDVATPCFSHVIDYMNGDYQNQESTEEYTEIILENDEYLKKCLEEDSIALDDVIHFKKFSVVDNDRPKMCADRIDGVILTGIGWTKSISKEDIFDIVNNLGLFLNEDGEEEIGFFSHEISKKVVHFSDEIDSYCHSKEDNYMMSLLADITKYAIDAQYFTYQDLYRFSENELFLRMKMIPDPFLQEQIRIFQTISKEKIPSIEISGIKRRDLNPLVKEKRFHRQ